LFEIAAFDWEGVLNYPKRSYSTLSGVFGEAMSVLTKQAAFDDQLGARHASQRVS
jgi:hypothetical protein